MGELVSTEKESFEMERGKQMVDPCQPLRHPGIVGIFRFESEPRETSGCCRKKPSVISAQAKICCNLRETYISVGDQPQANIVADESGLRGAKDGLDKLVVKVRDRKSTRLNSSHTVISYAVFCLKKKKVALH